MRALRFPKSGPSVKMSFGFRAYFGLKWAKKGPCFKENKKKRREWELGVTIHDTCCLKAWKIVGFLRQHVPNQRTHIYGIHYRFYGEDRRKICEQFLNKHTSSGSMQSPIDKDACFKNHPYALEAVDVTFQQTNRPSGNMQEGKICFSRKHKLNGYKVEVCVLPTGIATAFSKHYPGSIHDFTIFTKRNHVNKRCLAKINEEDQYIDEYRLSDKYPDQWAFLADKAYYGGQELC